MDRRRLAEATLRLLIAYAATIVLAGTLGQHFGQMLLPAFRAVIRWICADYWIMGFDLVDARGELRFVLVAVSTHYQIIGGNLVPPGGMVASSTLLGHALQQPILMYSLLLAWPGLSALRRIGLCAVGLPFLMLAECIDVPVVLGGNVLATVVEQFAPETLDQSALVQWIDFLGGGGRAFLSLLAAAGAVLTFRLIEARLPGKSDSNSPSTLAAAARQAHACNGKLPQ